MITGEQIRLLLFLRPERWACVGLIKILGHIAGLGVEIADLKKDAVFFRELLFEPRRKVELFEIVIQPMAVLGSIKGVQRVTRVAKETILRRALQPITAAGIFRARKNSKAVRGK